MAYAFNVRNGTSIEAMLRWDVPIVAGSQAMLEVLWLLGTRQLKWWGAWGAG